MSAIIKTENLHHVYGAGTPFERMALNNVNIEIERGEFIGLIGHTGSGKSTLIQHLNGLLKPSHGRVLFNGVDIWENIKRVREIRFKVGLVFQYPEHQLFEDTVYKDISFGPSNMGFTKSEIDERVREAAEFVGITDEQLSKSPFELSGGQKRRAAIAGVIAMRPEVLILDEPTAGLDPAGREEILSRIRGYHEKLNTTVILVTHSMEEIAKNASRIIVMEDAKVRMTGTAKDIFSHADELGSMGLAVPQITQVFLRLRNMGLDVDPSVYTIDQAEREIMEVRRKYDA
jgi:energy-coupling factor transport system ATP-binding protein